jgi:hypothetical protein
MKGLAPGMAQTAHHQRDRALLRGGSPAYSADGLLCERRNVEIWIPSSAQLFQRSNLEWKNRTLKLFAEAALRHRWALSCLHVPCRYDNFKTYPGHQEGIRGRSALRKGGYVKLLA